MARRLLAAVLRSGAAALMGAGVLAFTVGLVGGIPILMEGVTGLTGEGNRLPPESPAQTQYRLRVVAGLAALAAAGWVLARLGDVYRRREGPGAPGTARLAAEVLLLLGGVGLAVGALVWCHSGATRYEPLDAYRRVGTGAALGGPVCLGLGWALFRWSAGPQTRSEPPP